ncbi:hypothetical protein, partial [Streptomyces caelestis]|uniref:hypothetical protein n=1 Tax=Streptomyces caelestis TaxID=36816 RepID=UPI0036602592
MISEQPERLVRKMRAAGHTDAEAEDLAQETLVRALGAVTLLGVYVSDCVSRHGGLRSAPVFRPWWAG